MLMFTFDAAWLIICGLIFAAAKATRPVDKTSADFVASQMTVTMDFPGRACTCATRRRSSSKPDKSAFVFTVRETLTSLVAITSMLTFHLRNWLKMWAKKPAAPSIPALVMSISVTPFTAVIAQTLGTAPLCFCTMIEPGL